MSDDEGKYPDFLDEVYRPAKHETCFVCGAPAAATTIAKQCQHLACPFQEGKRD